jgi:hypothetical protein
VYGNAQHGGEWYFSLVGSNVVESNVAESNVAESNVAESNVVEAPSEITYIH